MLRALFNKVLLKYKNWMLGAGALGRPRRMVWGGKREEGSGWEHMYTCGGLNFYFLKKKSIKEIEKASDIGIRRGQKEYPLASGSNGIIL